MNRQPNPVWRIRPEISGEGPAIHDLTQQAFAMAAHRSGTEAFIVDALRTAGALAVSLVATDGGQIAGHVAVSPVRVNVRINGATDWYGLGPISVHPDYQRRGVGSALMRAALADTRSLGAAGCVLLGDPAYYARFGFTSAAPLELPGVPAAYFQALVFTGPVPVGIVSYHPAFEAVAPGP